MINPILKKENFYLSQSLIEKAHPMILASASQRRKDLLGLTGLQFTVHAAQGKELRLPGEKAEQMTLRLSAEKAMRVAFQFPDAWVLGADTVVELEGRIIGKPVDSNEAISILEEFSGRTHKVITGVSLIQQTKIIQKHFFTCTEVIFRTLTSREIQSYVHTGDPMDKAGAYGIQSGGGEFVESIHGSYSNVMGLPLEKLSEILKEIFES